MPPEKPDAAAPDFRYACYSLGVLVAVYVFNFIDRQILSILNEEIKRDLGLSDAQMGFLYGTDFAVFYALFGIPLGRLADVWVRRSLIAISLAFWSAMTALSGFARNFLELGAARIGVGIGEAGATPAAFSLLSDSFSPARRATVLAVYSSGIYIGAGLGISIGGQVVDRWNRAFAEGSAPFDLAGWQVAFLVVGLPGLLLALWVRTLREPPRGLMDGIESTPEPHPFREFGRELRAVLPGLTLWNLAARGASGRDFATNFEAALAVALAAAFMVYRFGNPAQWIFSAIDSDHRWVRRFRKSFMKQLLEHNGLAIEVAFSGGWIFPNQTPGWLVPLLGGLPYRFPLGITNWVLGQKQSD